MQTGPWIQTHSGRKFHLLDPHPSEILIDDIAHALSQVCRFAGHSARFYSVAEHSVHVSRIVPPEHQLAGLLHDATEAYLHDIASPLKKMLPEYKRIEEGVWFVISAKYGLDFDMPQPVKDADVEMLFIERRAFFREIVDAEGWGHGAVEPEKLADVGYMGWTPAHARQAFYDRYFELTRKEVAA